MPMTNLTLSGGKLVFCKLVMCFMHLFLAFHLQSQELPHKQLLGINILAEKGYYDA